MKNLNKMNDREIEMGVAGTGKSWHNEVCNFLKLQHFKRFLHKVLLSIHQPLQMAKLSS